MLTRPVVPDRVREERTLRASTTTVRGTMIRRSTAMANRLMARHLSPGRHIAKERYESVYGSAIISGGGVSVNSEGC